MPRIEYIARDFRTKALNTIEQANEIIEEYQEQGFTLTLRQLYYQFVARDLIPNSQKSYDNLGVTINNARLSGLIDWLAIEDRTRWLRRRTSWEGPAELVAACAEQFHIDPWETQQVKPEVWIEKDALIGVIEGVCHELSLPYFACRGYVSQSEQWRAGQRWQENKDAGFSTLVLHLGDHDPSGIDMTRDNEARGLLFSEQAVVFDRLALNMDQVVHYDPPPNPTKLSDSRAKGYIAAFGASSWELDALEPRVISGLVRDRVTSIIDYQEWAVAVEREEAGQERLRDVAEELLEGD